MPSKRNSRPWAPPSSGSADPSADAPEPRVYLRPLIPLALAFAAGVAAGDALPGFRPATWSLAVAAAGVLLRQWHRRRHARLSPLLLFLALGHLAIQPWAAPRFPPGHVVHVADGEYHRISGRLLAPPEPRFRGFRFVIAADKVDGRPVTGRVRAGAGEEAPRPAAGDRVVFNGRLKPVRSFRNPGGFDYERFMAFRGLFVTTWARKHSLRIRERAPASNPAQGIDRFRTRISRAIDDAVPGTAAAVLRALVVGDRNGISPDLRDQFARAGAAHLLAISGLHVGMVGGMAYLFLRAILGGIPALLWRGWVDRTAWLLALVPVVAYGLVSGGSPATLRAVGTAVLVLLCLAMRRRPDPANILALIAFLLLALHPPMLFSIGFQLSFAAVAAILLGMALFPPPTPHQRTLWTWLRQKIAAMAKMSAFAVWGTLPLTMRYFNQAVLVGLVSNFLLIPLIGILAVPVGLAGAALFPLSESLGSDLFWFAGFPVFLALKAIPFFAGLPLAAFRTITPTLLEMAAYYGAGVGLFLMIRFRTTPDRRKAAALLLSGGLLVLALDAAWWTHRRFGRETLRVTAVDIGQGTATLLELPGGRTLLVDGGGFYDNRIFDVGERVVAPLLWRKRILTLDAVILSHPDSDHLNGLVFILEQFQVRQFWTPDLAAEGAGMARVREILARRNIPAPAWEDLPRRRSLGETRLEILHPAADTPAERWVSDNNRSLVLRVSLGSVSFLLPGDIEAEAEAALVRRHGDRLESTALLAPHHGSDSSSSPAFVERVAPEWVVASAGYRNRHRFPDPSVVHRYRRRGGAVLRTDLHGAVELVTDGRRLRVRTGRPRDTG